MGDLLEKGGGSFRGEKLYRGQKVK